MRKLGLETDAVRRDYYELLHACVTRAGVDVPTAWKVVDNIIADLGGCYLPQGNAANVRRDEEICDLRRAGESTKCLADRFGISQRHIQLIVRGVVPVVNISQGELKAVGYSWNYLYTSLGSVTREIISR
ncbi:MAG: hypothetical protein HY915_04505 [Desulfovibrio sp.]|nr:hypothetical protein [Desulfovibrio sp.]